MKKKFSMLEFLLLIGLTAFIYIDIAPIFQDFSEEQIPKRSPLFLAGFIGFVIYLKSRTEGNRWHICIFIPAFILAVYHRIFRDNSQPSLMYISSALTLLHLILIFVFPVYDMPSIIPLAENQNAQYNVSSCNLKVDEDSPLTLFYPTHEESNTEDTFMNENEYLDNLMSIAKRDFYIPEGLFNFVTSFYWQYKVRVSPRLPVINKPLKPIIFSHGFLASRNGYSFILKHLASFGYAVFSVDHKDAFIQRKLDLEKDKLKKLKMLKEQKENEIELRVSQMKAVIDLIHDKERLNKLLGQNISLEQNNIILMGHSYGGATAQYASYKYQKQIKAAVLLDPWLFAMPDEYLNIPCEVPLLYLNSATFADSLPWSEINRRNNSVLENCKEKNKSFSCFIEKMNHIQQGDICFLLPVETYLGGMNKYPSRTLEFNLYNVKLIQLYLQNIVFASTSNQTVTSSINKNDPNLCLPENHQYLQQQIFIPMRKDSFAYFRQEFVPTYLPEKGSYKLEFKGKSPF